METIGYAALQVIPSMKGVQSEIGRQLGGLDQIGEKAGRSFGSKFSAGVGSTAKVAGAVVGAAGTAVAGLGATALKAGYDYNTLGQRANAAFKTLLGSSTDARKFMGEIAEFAASSPFPRQAFIEGAQIMSAFGYETEKIIPALGAVQDAVAASGGSAQQLSEVTFVLAQIQSAGKITATDLMQLGQRGINAAELIGSQMGKTGKQIKDDITDGALDAGTALDALTAGMKEKFGGAADNVKATWIGAVDRVKGAMRDIGSEWLEPFIGFEGGGAAVGWANTVADVFRAFQRGPARDLIPFMYSIADAGDRVMSVFGRLGTDEGMSKFVDRVRPLLPALAGLATGLAVFSARGLLGGLPVIGSFAAGLNPVVAGVSALALATPQARDAFRDVFDAVSPLVVELATSLLPSLEATSDVAGGVLPSAIRTFGTALEVALEIAIPFARIVGNMLDLVADLTPVLVAGGAAWATWVVAPQILEGLAASAAAASDAVMLTVSSVAKFASASAAWGGGAAGAINAVWESLSNIGTGTAVVGGIAAIAAAWVGANALISSSQRTGAQGMSEWIDSLKIDTADVESIEKGYYEIADRIAEARQVMEDKGGWTRFWQRATPFTTNEWDEAKGAWDEGQAELDERLNALMTLTGEAQSSLGMDNSSFNRWIQELGINLETTAMSSDELAGAIGDAAMAAQNGTPETDALATAYSELADETTNSTDALKAWKGVVDTILGVPMNLMQANAGWAKALDGVGESLKANGDSLDFYNEKGQANIAALTAAVDAAVNMSTAYGEAGNGAEDAANRLQFAVLELDRTAEAAGLTRTEIDTLKASMGLIPENIQTIVEAATGDAQAKLDEVTKKVEGLDGKTATITIRAAVDNIRGSMIDPFRNIGFGSRRHGGIDNAHIGHGDLIRWAEPATGGEAYIPRLGAKSRSESILRTAAGWYGGRYVSPEEARRKAWPMANGGLVHAREAADGGGRGGISIGDVTVMSGGGGYESGRDLIDGALDAAWREGF